MKPINEPKWNVHIHTINGRFFWTATPEGFVGVKILTMYLTTETAKKAEKLWVKFAEKNVIGNYKIAKANNMSGE